MGWQKENKVRTVVKYLLNKEENLEVNTDVIMAVKIVELEEKVSQLEYNLGQLHEKKTALENLVITSLETNIVAIKDQMCIANTDHEAIPATSQIIQVLSYNLRIFLNIFKRTTAIPQNLDSTLGSNDSIIDSEV